MDKVRTWVQVPPRFGVDFEALRSSHPMGIWVHFPSPQSHRWEKEKRKKRQLQPQQQTLHTNNSTLLWKRNNWLLQKARKSGFHVHANYIKSIMLPLKRTQLRRSSNPDSVERYQWRWEQFTWFTFISIEAWVRFICCLSTVADQIGRVTQNILGQLIFCTCTKRSCHIFVLKNFQDTRENQNKDLNIPLSS